jgi:DNA-binding GntR family transcriptional regulator
MTAFPPVTRLRRRRLVDDATQALRGAILSGRLPTGARLRQTDLAAQLGISRTPIREALGKLEQEGLVELLPGGGVRVAVMDLPDAVELYDVREVLDGLAARGAAERAGPGALARLEKALGRMAQCLERQDANQWFAAHVAFHEEIFRASGNRRLGAFLSVVRLSIRHFHPLLLTTERRLGRAWEEHRAILDAITARDAAGAERLARTHIANAREIVLTALRRGDDHGAVQA